MWNTRAITFVNAVVVASDGELLDSIRIRDRVIDRLGGSPQRRDTVVDLNGAAVFPGLINAHDHLELNSFPRLKWRSRYFNAREWIADFQPRFKTDPALAVARRDTLSDRLWVGGLKNVLSGVTTVCHHNPLHRPLRARFPVRIVRNFGLSHSLYIDGTRVSTVYRKTPPEWPWIIHAAEGVDERAIAEIETLGSMGCLGRNTVIVHGVGLDSVYADFVIALGGSLVWCPTSNQFLFGRTADVRRFDAERRLALGTDSRLSGEGDLLDELRAAHRTHQLGPRALARAVTTNAAAVLRLPRAGRLLPGAPADLTVIRSIDPDPYESLVSATRADVRLTMIDGAPVVTDRSLARVFDAKRESYARVWLDGSERLMATWIARRVAKMALCEPGLEIES
jgi:cytosine/adenosine deaminase-related metal-dependent hydrolase